MAGNRASNPLGAPDGSGSPRVVPSVAVQAPCLSSPSGHDLYTVERVITPALRVVAYFDGLALLSVEVCTPHACVRAPALDALGVWGVVGDLLAGRSVRVPA